VLVLVLVLVVSVQFVQMLVSVLASVVWLVLLVRAVAGEAWESVDMEQLAIAGRQDDGVSAVVDIVVMVAAM